MHQFQKYHLLINDLNPDKDQDCYELVKDEHFETNYEEISDKEMELDNEKVLVIGQNKKVCKICKDNKNQKFETISEIDDHMSKIHNFDLGLSCEKCQKTYFHSTLGLDLHYQESHRIER